jgi:hypothetical protein
VSELHTGGLVPRSTYVPQGCVQVLRKDWIDALDQERQAIVIRALEGPEQMKALQLIDDFLTRHERWMGEGDEQPSAEP